MAQRRSRSLGRNGVGGGENSRDLLQHGQHARRWARFPRREGVIVHHHPLVVVPGTEKGEKHPSGSQPLPEDIPAAWGGGGGSIPPSDPTLPRITAPRSRAAVEPSEDGGPLGTAAGQAVGHDVPQPLQDAAPWIQVLPPVRVVVPDGGFQRYLWGGER